MGTVKLDSRLRERLRERIMLANQDDWTDEVAARETIRFYYPDLNEKEMSVCENIIYMKHDLVPLDELVFRLADPGRMKSHVFSTEAEVLNTITALKEKNIIFDKSTSWTIKAEEKRVSLPEKIIGFCIKAIEDQALTAMNEALYETKDRPAFLDPTEVPIGWSVVP